MEQRNSSIYRVLARKYRPDNFDSLIGQEALVQTLTNAIELNRLAHAFILTGVRGVGKTTTARILAKGLNCIGPDSTAKPNINPCNQCEPCKAIQMGNHIDVLEMDAASNTGVDDIREIIDSSVYRPVSARYKIYIIDEVHMLSKNAFNALLKTLEEPPDTVKFIFATTEIRKVPITILSRCQRFDLRRVPMDLLIKHLSNIATAENIQTEPEAIRLIAYAAEGSVRDCLSLLDQACALGANNITTSVIENMLGHANSNALLDLLQSCLEGDIQIALSSLKKAVDIGAEPEQIISDLMDFTHQASLIASNSDLPDISDSAREKLSILAKLGIPQLARCWQILLKGYQEIKFAPRPEASAEMLIIRLAHTSPMPTPSEILEKLPKAPIQTAREPDKNSELLSFLRDDDKTVNQSNNSDVSTQEESNIKKIESEQSLSGKIGTEHEQFVKPLDEENNSPLANLRDIAEYCEKKGALILAADIRNYVELVNFNNTSLEIQLVEGASEDLPGKIMQFLNANTDKNWQISISDKPGNPTLQEEDKQVREKQLYLASKHPVAQEVSKVFPGAKVIDVVEPTQSESLSSSSSMEKSNFITNLEQSGLQKPGNRQEEM